MKSQDLAKYKLPDMPGVYFFLGRRKEILYIGRATSLRDRVRSYFSPLIGEARGPKILQLMEEIRSLDYRKTDSVLEAILLEADLIKKFKPLYNTDEKDDKSFNCVVITDEDFPRVLLVRKKELDVKGFSYDPTPHTEDAHFLSVYGPFPDGGKLAVALKIIRKIFPFRDRCEVDQGKPCFNRQIGLCPGVCTGEITKEEYRNIIRNIQRFFTGKKSSIIRDLTARMKRYAAVQEFEKAARVKHMLFALQHIADVSLVTETVNHPSESKNMRIEAFDVAHTSGQKTVGVMTVISGGLALKSAYRKFIIRTAIAGDDVGALTEVLERRFRHPEWGTPEVVAVDGGQSQLNAARKVLSRVAPSVGLVSVVKNERHRFSHFLGDETLFTRFRREILLGNSEAHRFAISFHRRKRDTLL